MRFKGIAITGPQVLLLILKDAIPSHIDGSPGKYFVTVYEGTGDEVGKVIPPTYPSGKRDTIL